MTSWQSVRIRHHFPSPLARHRDEDSAVDTRRHPIKIAIVAQHASPLDPRAGASPRPDDAGPGELTRILIRQGPQGDRVPAEAQPDVPDRAGFCGGLRVRIPVGAADTRGDTELLAHRPAFSDPLRARWRRELPDVLHAISWSS